MTTREQSNQFMYDLTMVLETTKAARFSLEQDCSNPPPVGEALRLAEEKLQVVIDGLDEFGFALNKAVKSTAA